MEFSDLRFVREVPQNLIVVPALLDNPALKPFLQEYEKQVREKYKGNVALGKLKQGRGSNLFISALTYDILRPFGVRPAIPADDKDGKISAIVKGKFYTDFNALIIRSAKPIWKPNKKLLENLIHITEEEQGSIQFPFMVTGVGLDICPEDEHYGLKFTPTQDFAYVHDKRLDGEKYPTGTMFNSVDDLGLPVFDEKGKRKWYAKTGSVLRFCLDSILDLSSIIDYLPGSYTSGRVVIESAEGTRATK